MDERSSSPADVNSTTASGRSAREDVTNTSDSSGLRAGDEAAGERMKDQLRRGATEVSRMD